MMAKIKFLHKGKWHTQRIGGFANRKHVVEHIIRTGQKYKTTQKYGGKMYIFRKRKKRRSPSFGINVNSFGF